MYEIEHRALLTEESYATLAQKLAEAGVSLGSDDKEVAYYIFPDKLLKVVRNISKSTGVLSLKLNTLGNGSSFEEHEVTFPAEDFDTMRAICGAISSPDQVIVGTQRRTNFLYKDVEIALKWSEDWQYHAEFEVVVQTLDEKDAADAKILAVAEELSVTPMTQEEIAEFSAKVRASKK